MMRQWLCASFCLVFWTAAAAVEPEVPVPQPRPAQAGDPPPKRGSAASPSRLNEKHPAGAREARSAGRDTADAPALAVPEPRPEPPAAPIDKPPVSPRPADMPAEEVACRAKLRQLGAAFEERPPLADPAGCSAPWPISLSSLSSDVTVAPAAELNCATALAAATFVRDHAAPAAAKVLGSPIAGIAQASAYVCRPRNGTSKLSEHAFGNALDIGAFVLRDGRSVAVGRAANSTEAEFLLAVRLAACGPFTTVLGPGSDADHATHFHLDLAERRSGSLFCQ
jgi:hypothetical protein